VQAGEMLGVYERVIRGDQGRVRYHYVLIDFLCRPVGGDVKAGSDAADVRWFARDELPALNLADDTNDVVRKGFARRMERRASSPVHGGVAPHRGNCASAILATCTGKPVFGSSDFNSNTLKPSPVIS